MKLTIAPVQTIHEMGKRKNQEDSIYTSSDLFILCDGMGGYEQGEVASQLVCDTFATVLGSITEGQREAPDTLFTDALTQTLDRLDELCAPGRPTRAGTTLTLLCLHSGGIFAAHIGDSRIYHLRPATQQILYKSRDHSLVYDLFLTHIITQQEMATHPRRNIITRALMPNADPRPEADVTHITDIQPGDYLMLLSDGMLEQMTDEELLTLIGADATDEEKRQQLIDATADNSDNHSAIIIRILNVEQEDGDDQLPDDEQTVNHNAMRYETFTPTPPDETTHREKHPYALIAKLWKRITRNIE